MIIYLNLFTFISSYFKDLINIYSYYELLYTVHRIGHYLTFELGK
jgi:hypothetical protein